MSVDNHRTILLKSDGYLQVSTTICVNLTFPKLCKSVFLKNKKHVFVASDNIEINLSQYICTLSKW